MHHLTTNTHPVYSAPTAAKSVVGATTSINQEAYSRYNVTFFVLVINAQNKSPSLWALYRAEATQVVEGRYLFGVRSNLHPVVVTLYSAHHYRLPPMCWVLKNLTKKVLVMDYSIFTLRKDVTPSQLSNALYENAIQACALNDVLGEHLSNRSELSEFDYYEKTSKLQWALAALLEQQRVVSDKLVMQRISCGEFEVGEAA